MCGAAIRFTDHLAVLPVVPCHLMPRCPDWLVLLPTQHIANMAPSDVPFEGIKIQLKGRMSGKGGKASKKVWVWGRTGSSAHDDPVDYAHEAVVTRAGYIGIKVGVCVHVCMRALGDEGGAAFVQ